MQKEWCVFLNFWILFSCCSRYTHRGRVCAARWCFLLFPAPFTGDTMKTAESITRSRGCLKDKQTPASLLPHHCLETPVWGKGKIKSGGGGLGRGNTTNKIKENQKGSTKKPRGNRERLALASCSTWREMLAGPGRDPLPLRWLLGIF